MLLRCRELVVRLGLLGFLVIHDLDGGVGGDNAGVEGLAAQMAAEAFDAVQQAFGIDSAPAEALRNSGTFRSGIA